MTAASSPAALSGNLNASRMFPPSRKRDISRQAAPTQSPDDQGVSYKCPRVPA